MSEGPTHWSKPVYEKGKKMDVRQMNMSSTTIDYSVPIGNCPACGKVVNAKVTYTLGEVTITGAMATATLLGPTASVVEHKCPPVGLRLSSQIEELGQMERLGW